MRPILSDAEWVDSRIAGLPARWQQRLRRTWERRSPIDYRAANIELREATAALHTVRVPLDASDAEIREAADAQALRCMDRLAVTRLAKPARASMERICAGQGISPPAPETEDHPAIARMCCPLWWRRRLRKHQGQTVEAAAVRLGYVNKFRDLYISNERLAARLQQNRRNAATLEATLACNETGQVFTLAELAAKSPANKAIRRAELMTRIAGFERYADAEGHQGVFVTLTCPSRFHRFLIVNDGKAAVSNTKYAASENPGTAHRYMTRVWARTRSALARQGLRPYGFRISEPQHDGTPHWHLLLFCPAEKVTKLMAVFRQYALVDSGNEPGAVQHRCDFKLIDKTRGTAAGYIAKYVAKNIDGEHVGQDLEGHPAKESAKRVEAWCANWTIRQFQQIGGPSVTVWRELRRISALPEDAPEHLRRAHRAANKQIQRDGDETATVAWDEYCRAQGGATPGRDAAIKLATHPADVAGRYGDAWRPRPIGVETFGTASFAAATRNSEGHPAKAWLVESERRTWTIERTSSRRADWRSFSAAKAKPAPPWTRVNNCTGTGDATRPEAGPMASAKAGQVHQRAEIPNVRSNESSIAVNARSNSLDTASYRAAVPGPGSFAPKGSDGWSRVATDSNVV